MRPMKLVLACAIASILAGCGTLQTGSVAGGEAHALTGPEYAIAGKSSHDQEWIDETIEAGVASLGWARPKPRPAEWDKPAPAAPTPKAKPKRKGFGWKVFTHGEKS